jgi:hypothetical protein
MSSKVARIYLFAQEEDAVSTMWEEETYRWSGKDIHGQHVEKVSGKPITPAQMYEVTGRPVKHPHWQCPRCNAIMFWFGATSHMNRCWGRDD